MSTTNDETRDTIPPDKWIAHPASDHADLDRPEPVYGDSLTGAAKSEYEAALTLRKHGKPAETAKPKSRSRKRSRGRKKKS